MRDNYYMATSAARSFTVLEHLCLHGEQGVSEISRSLGLTKSAAHRAVAMLEHLGYLRQTAERGGYTPTLKLFRVANQIPNLLLPIPEIHPVLEELARQFRETVNLAVLDHDGVVYVDKVESAETLRMDLAVGRRVPIHCTALGKALVAHLADHGLPPILAGGLRRYTRKTIVDGTAFGRELARVRRLGYALDDEELNLGVRCIAAPLVGHLGRPVAAISIAGPAVRMTARVMRQMVHPLKAAAERISSQLGAPRRSGAAGGQGKAGRLTTPARGGRGIGEEGRTCRRSTA